MGIYQPEVGEGAADAELEDDEAEERAGSKKE
jgi:hypothetical protein